MPLRQGANFRGNNIIDKERVRILGTQNLFNSGTQIRNAKQNWEQRSVGALTLERK